MEQNIETSQTGNTPTNLFKTTVFKSNILIVLLSILLIITVGIASLFHFQIRKLSKELSIYQSANPTPSATPIATTKCKDPRPEVCTMECIQNPPYICGSDSKSYCSVCQACSNPEVAWYEMRTTPCEKQ